MSCQDPGEPQVIHLGNPVQNLSEITSVLHLFNRYVLWASVVWRVVQENLFSPDDTLVKRLSEVDILKHSVAFCQQPQGCGYLCSTIKISMT